MPCCHAGGVDPTQHAFQHTHASLTQVEIMMALEEKFEIQLDEEGTCVGGCRVGC